jgi:maltose/moltooligosaccharide transporter
MAIAAQEGSQAEIQSEDLERKPLLSFRAILLMNFGFFGIQYSFGLQQTAINPIYEFLGADPAQLPLLNLAGPVTGLFIQPLIGAMSDRTWSDRWGRRKPYFLIGAIGCSICLFLWPFVFALWMAFILLWLLDASNNTAMEPYRAFISDKLPESQLARGFLTQSMFVGAVAMLFVSPPKESEESPIMPLGAPHRQRLQSGGRLRRHPRVVGHGRPRRRGSHGR